MSVSLRSHIEYELYDDEFLKLDIDLLSNEFD